MDGGDLREHMKGMEVTVAVGDVHHGGYLVTASRGTNAVSERVRPGEDFQRAAEAAFRRAVMRLLEIEKFDRVRATR